MDRVIDGGVEIDGGTEAEIRAELATETVDKSGHGTATGAQAPKTGAAAAAADEAEADAAAEGDKSAAAGADGGVPKVPAAGAKPKRDRSFNGRIRQLTEETYTERRARLALEEENARLKTELEARRGGRTADDGDAGERRAAPKRAAVHGEVGGVPLAAEKFPSYAEMLKTNPDLESEDYNDLRQDWRSAKSRGLEAQEKAGATESAEFAKTADTFYQKMEPVLRANPKFYETIDPILTETPARSALPVGHPGRNMFAPFVVEQVVKHCEHPDGVMAKLSADGSKELQRLRALSPDEVIRAIAKIDLSIRPADAGSTGTSTEEIGDEGEELEELEAGGAQTSNQSAAEPPVKPVRGSSQKAVELDDATDEDSDDAWFRKEQAKQLRKLNARA